MVNPISGFGQFDVSSISKMRQNFFNKLDSSGDGSIDKTEFATALQGMNDINSNDIFSQLDTNGDNTIGKDELNAMMDKMDENMKKNPPPPMGMMGGNGSLSGSSDDNKDTEIFNSLDTNGDGYISATELSAAHDETAANKIMADADTDGDGKISKTESDNFLAKMKESMQTPAASSSNDLASSSFNSLDMEMLNKMIQTILGNFNTSSTTSTKNSFSFYA